MNQRVRDDSPTELDDGASVFIYSVYPCSRLFGSSNLVDVAFLAAWRKGGEGFVQSRVCVEPRLQFFR